MIYMLFIYLEIPSDLFQVRFTVSKVCQVVDGGQGGCNHSQWFCYHRINQSTEWDEIKMSLWGKNKRLFQYKYSTIRMHTVLHSYAKFLWSVYFSSRFQDNAFYLRQYFVLLYQSNERKRLFLELIIHTICLYASTIRNSEWVAHLSSTYPIRIATDSCISSQAFKDQD